MLYKHSIYNDFAVKCMLKCQLSISFAIFCLRQLIHMHISASAHGGSTTIILTKLHFRILTKLQYCRNFVKLISSSIDHGHCFVGIEHGQLKFE